MTSADHSSGTERCYEAFSSCGSKKCFENEIVNIQGDEPFIKPQQIDEITELFEYEDTESTFEKTDK